jgi:glycolate oxidase FAD binding subunit
VWTFSQPTEAFSAAKSLRESHEPIAALESVYERGDWKLAVRIEGRDKTVQSVSDRIATLIGGNALRLNGAESATWWSEYVARQELSVDSAQTLVRCAVRPRDTATLAAGLIPALAGIAVSVPYLAGSPGLGSITLSLDLGDTGSPERLAKVQTVLLALADTATILTAPSTWKSGLDVWGRHPDGFDYMQSLRREFDPQRTINPGRFAGFL